MRPVTMSATMGCSYPPVFVMDAGGRQYLQPVSRADPALVPCWNFPPARSHSRRGSCGGLNAAVASVLVMVLLLVFAALGFGAYQIFQLQNEVLQLKQYVCVFELILIWCLFSQQENAQNKSPEKLIDLRRPDAERAQRGQVAAHLIGGRGKSGDSLVWGPRVGRAFTSGVVYRNNGLLVNETGLYFVYSRVEFLDNHCSPRDHLVHSVHMRRTDGHPLTLMEDHREGFCVVGKEQVWTSGSGLGSVQKLQKHDFVYVSVSDPAKLSHNFQSNYFGLYKID
ncbi:tumor necrosis factor ligand superfamily member 6 [Chanos chanos]|uniref:Tumor necrosis factor ligand superfamily member 6 n=1 Tax=Chanos chanos TaxID=29144 RepID=A0A6J2V2U1_CHACN|nr:tumor necrosis factor ligand superfamily member 6 [Chanos chanos]